VEQLEGRTLLSSYSAATVSDLIADINAANKGNGSNTITLTAPTTSPYVLTAVDNKADGANGLPVIAKNDNLTIIGNADTIERSTASGTSAFRLFDVASGGSLTLQNLTLQNGLAFGSCSASEGGAIFNQGTLVLSGVTVQGNIAAGSDGLRKNGNDASGGGVWSGGSLTLENGTVVQNNEAEGGAALGDSLKYVGGNAFGGGIYVAGGTANITGATIDNNVALGGDGILIRQVDNFIVGQGGSAAGGGVYIAAGTVTLSNDTVDGNQANGADGHTHSSEPPPVFGSGFGGGICLVAGTVTLSSDTVVGNSATPSPGGGGGAEGGGIYIGSLTGNPILPGVATATFCNDTVQSNLIGGDIYIVSGATVYIDSFTVAHTANIGGSYILRNC
jgi:hypothetical protein